MITKCRLWSQVKQRGGLEQKLLCFAHFVLAALTKAELGAAQQAWAALRVCLHQLFLCSPYI